MTESYNTNSNNIISDNNGYQQSSSLQIRLDTDPMIRKIEMYLRGYEEKLIIQEGQPTLSLVKSGKEKADEFGIQAIMGRVQTILNPQVVQGNFDDSRYGEYLCRVRKDISTDLMVNLYRYKINISDYNSIINMIMGAVEPFISRLINNKERESYSNTIRSVESNTNQIKGGGFSIPFVNK